MSIYSISIRPHTHMIVRAAIVAAALLAVLLAAGSANAQTMTKLTLRATVEVADQVVRLGDLADGAGDKADIKLFLAPAPGTSGTVQTDRVVDAIRRHGIEYVETGGLAQIVVSRKGRRVAREDIAGAIAEELIHRGHARTAANLEVRLDASVTAFSVEAAATGPVRVMSIQADPRARRFAARITIDGSTAAAGGVTVTGYAEEVAEVPTLARPIQRGETISPADIVVQKLPVAMLADDALVSMDALAGMAARRALRAGQPLRNADVMLPIVVRRDDMLAIVFERPGLTLSVRGRALASGARGDVVAVTNLQSNRIIQAEVTGPGTVVVRGVTSQVASAAR